MDGLSFTVLDFSFEHVISFNYGCATVISLTDDSSFYKKAEAENFPLSKKSYTLRDH